MKQLIDAGYVKAVANHRGRYIVTKKAKMLIQKIER